MGTMITMFAPDGTTGEIPADKVQSAQQAGFQRAMSMVSPDGKSTGYIPENKVNDAAKAGFRFGTADHEQPTPASLYKEALFNPVGSGATSGITGGLEQIGGRAMQALTSPILHPLDTVTGIVNSVAHPIDTAKQRIQEFGQEWQKSPALALENAAGDIASAVEGGRMGNAVASKAADLAGPTVSRGLLLGKTPEAAYESALKPSITLSGAERENLVQTGLQNRIPVSKGGLQTLSNRIDELNTAIKNEISSDPTRRINTVPALKNLDSLRANAADQVTPQGDLADINQVETNFLNNPKLQPSGLGPQPGGLSAAEAQSMKQGTYRALGKKSYGELKGASIEAQKALARGLKDEIANQFPEISNLNAQESKLLDLQPILERAVNRISNHQLIGIGTPVAGAAAKAVSGSSSVGVVASTLKSVLDNPFVKSRLAISLSKGARIPYSQAVARIGAYSTALGATASAAQETPDDQTENK